MNDIGYTRGSKLFIKRLNMQDTGTYNQQYARPYNTVMDNRTLDLLTDKVMQSNNRRLTGSMISGLSRSFIQPQATPEGMIGITNGWNEKRIRFVLEVEIHNTVGSVLTQYIQGYTNFPGITSNASIAPDMVFYINGVVQTRRVNVMTPTGRSEYENVVDNSHLMASADFQSIYQPEKQILIRPQDVFLKMTTGSMYDDLGQPIVGHVDDARITLRKDAQKSTRLNSMASSYAARIIDSYAQASALSDFGQDDISMLSSAISYVQEGEASIDPFLSAVAQFSSTVATNTFRFDDLVSIDGNVVNVINYMVAGPTQRTNVHETGQTSNWHGSDLATQSATILSQSIPSIMMDLMINKAVFKSSNHDLTGQMQTVLIDCRGFSGNTNLTRNFQMFCFRLEQEVLKDLTFNNSLAYTLEMTVDLFGETWISISIGDSGVIDFVTPSFCDNLFIPVVTTNKQTLNTLTRDFESLSEHIKQAVDSTQSYGDKISITV